MADQKAPPKPEGVDEIEKQGLEEIVRALRNNTDPQVRQYAAYLLGQVKNPRAIQPLIEALADFDKGVREQAVLALSSIGKVAVASLTEAMNDPKWQTRYRVVEALGKIADRQVISPLIQALKDERDHVRYMAAKGPRDLRDSGATDPLVILLKDENEYVRRMAAAALGVIGGARVRKALEEALATEEKESVKKAIRNAMK